MKIGETIFMFGKAPSKGATYMESYPHPKDKRNLVKFVKYPEKEGLYVNVKDLIISFEKYKTYSQIIKRMLPRGRRDLNRVWISTKAWNEMRQGIDGGYVKEVIDGWKELHLF